MKTKILPQILLVLVHSANILPASSLTWQETLQQASGLVRAGRFAEAEHLLLPLTATEPGAPPAARRAVALNNLASLYQDQREYRKAERAYLDCLAEWQRLDATKEFPLAHPLNNLASLYSVQGHFSRAEALYRRSLQLRIAEHGAGGPAVARLHNNLGVQLERQGRLDEAQREFELCASIWESRPGTSAIDRATVHNNLGHIAEMKKQYDKAESHYRQALDIWAAHEAAASANAALVAVGLGRTLAITGRLVESDSLLTAARKALEAQRGMGQLDIAAAIAAQALLYRKMNRKAEARELEEQARAIEAGSQLGFSSHRVDWMDLKGR